MTLCIGALSRTIEPFGHPCIVLCFESKLSTEGDEFASETGYKYHRLNGQLVSMFAGSPSKAQELAWIYREYLKEHTLDKLCIVEQLREPILTLKRRLANSYFARTLGLSYTEMLTNGTKWFGEVSFKKKIETVESHPLRVDLVIAGFVGFFPVLCELKDGELELKNNYAMVGNGSYTAEPVMHARKHTDQSFIFDAIYTVYEAKKMGEYSPSVGAFTRIFVLHPPRDEGTSMQIDIVTPVGIQHLEEMFSQYGPKPLPMQGAFPFPLNSLARVV
jgi:hypothetical protein